MKKLGIVLAAALMLGACSPSDNPISDPEPVRTSEVPSPEPTTETPSAAPSPEPTTEAPSPEPTEEPSPEPTSTLSPEQEAASETALEFLGVFEELMRDFDGDLQPLADTTGDEMFRMVTEVVEMQKERRVYQGGDVERYITGIEEPSVVDGETRIVVSACVDTSGMVVMDADTNEPAANPNPVNYQQWTLVVAERDRWRVLDGSNWTVEGCE